MCTDQSIWVIDPVKLGFNGHIYTYVRGLRPEFCVDSVQRVTAWAQHFYLKNKDTNHVSFDLVVDSVHKAIIDLIVGASDDMLDKL